MKNYPSNTNWIGLNNVLLKQLLGEKSEKRLINNQDQQALGEILKDIDTQLEGETKTITYELRKKQRPEDSVADQGLRFNNSIPVEVIHMSAPKMQGEDSDQGRARINYSDWSGGINYLMNQEN